MSDSAIQQLQTVTGGFGLIIAFIAILWWVLCVALFFKVWNMTNDVNRMKDMLKEWLDLEHPVIKEDVKSERQSSDQV